MKLYYAPASPYARKVIACAIARGIDRQIERIAVNPYETPADLVAANPLSKIPCLVTSDGMGLYDSPVICEFLDSIGDASPMFPAAGGARWRALRHQATADGLMDAAIARRAEAAKPAYEGRDALIARHANAMSRALDLLESAPPHRSLDIGTIAVAAALGYLDLRFAHEPWRTTRPALAAWEAAIAPSACLAESAPPAP
jgi:glutathione S-transferase